MCAGAGAGIEREQAKETVVKNIIVIFMRTLYILQTYNSIMNDKFMCLCFPEFSREYMYMHDDIMCFYTSPFFSHRCSLLSGIERKKLFYWVIFPLRPYHFYRSRPRPHPAQPKPLLHWLLRVWEPPLKFRMLSTMLDRKISLKGH